MGDFFDTAYVILMHGSVKRPLICSRSIDIGQLRLDLKVKRRLNRFEKRVALTTRSNLPRYRQLHFLSLTNPTTHPSIIRSLTFFPTFFSLNSPTHLPSHALTRLCIFSRCLSHARYVLCSLFRSLPYSLSYSLPLSLSHSFSLYVSSIHSPSLSLSLCLFLSRYPILYLTLFLSLSLSLSPTFPSSLFLSRAASLSPLSPSLALFPALSFSCARARALPRCCQALRFGGMMCPKALRVGDLPGMEILQGIINIFSHPVIKMYFHTTCPVER